MIPNNEGQHGAESFDINTLLAYSYRYKLTYVDVHFTYCTCNMYVLWYVVRTNHEYNAYENNTRIRVNLVPRLLTNVRLDVTRWQRFDGTRFSVASDYNNIARFDMKFKGARKQIKLSFKPSGFQTTIRCFPEFFLKISSFQHTFLFSFQVNYSSMYQCSLGIVFWTYYDERRSVKFLCFHKATRRLLT